MVTARNVPPASAAPRPHAGLTVDARCLRIALDGGFQLVLPLAWVRSYGARPVGEQGILLSVTATFGDVNGNYDLTFEGSFIPGAARDGLLEHLNAAVGGHVRMSHLPEPGPEEPGEPLPGGAWSGRPAHGGVGRSEAAEPAERPGARAERGTGPSIPAEPVAEPSSRADAEKTPSAPAEPARAPAPPEPFKGPSLPADSEDWVMLWPLDDTVALSAGRLLEPPAGA